MLHQYSEMSLVCSSEVASGNQPARATACPRGWLRALSRSDLMMACGNCCGVAGAAAPSVALLFCAALAARLRRECARSRLGAEKRGGHSGTEQRKSRGAQLSSSESRIPLRRLAAAIQLRTS